MPSSPPAGGQGTEAQRVGTVSGGSSKDGSTCKAGAEGVDGKTVYRNVGSVSEPARAGWCAPRAKAVATLGATKKGAGSGIWVSHAAGVAVAV